MLICFAISSVLAVFCFLIHFLGLVTLSGVLRRMGVHPASLSTLIGQGAGILFIVISLFALHSIEIWIYALTYLALGEFESVEPAIYYSITCFTTAGLGDVVLSEKWRIIGAVESMNGFLLIGWSTAFLVSLTARVRAFEVSADELDD